ncbi:MAG: aminotransferase class V-fold PLP-dependent enzyme [Vicinamibacterales bacterium]|jgi:selenocysteine lyase/cysteine desulfurase|nr:aminotransferase class V-fold PLP-dependent enzyme [Vicinamibacterales bacterium]
MKVEPGSSDATAAFEALEQGVYAVLENYSNVHRGSGHHSMVSTYLFEQARGIVLEHLGLSAGKYVVIFGTPRSADTLTGLLERGSYLTASSRDVGLPLGVRALAIERRALPTGPPVLTGGGTARLVAPGWVMWATAPGRFEAGTPGIVNVIAFARALLLRRRLGDHAFEVPADVTRTAAGILRVDDLERFSGRALLQALRQTLIGRGVRVPTVDGDQPYVNLDNGASTPTFEPVWAAFRQAWRQPADVQQDLIRDVRSIVAEAVGAPPSEYDVIFTANTTDAINLVAESEGRAGARGTGPVVINTLLEHNSNELPWRAVPGATLLRLPMNGEGFLDLGKLEAWLRAYNQDGQHGATRVTLVAVSGASNVLGVFNDLAEIAQIVHRYGARLLVDGAQLVAHRKVEMAGAGIDYFAFSAHKVYAPFGTGVLVARKGLLAFSPAEMEGIRSAAEENVAGIAALGKALVLLHRIGMDVIQEEEQALTARALLGMGRVPGIKIHGIANPESPSFAFKGGVVPFDLKGVLSHTVARRLAARGGIGVRSGCHCAHLTVKRIAAVPPWAEQLQRLILTVLRKFELPGVVRVSLGIENSEADVDTLIHVLDGIARRPKAGPAEMAFRQQMDDACKAAAQRVYAQ